MAKSFKQLPSVTDQPAKRTSEKDILDFLEQDRLMPEPATEAEPAGNSVAGLAQSGTNSNTRNTSNTKNSSNTSNIGIEEHEKKRKPAGSNGSNREASRAVQHQTGQSMQSPTKTAADGKAHMPNSNVTDVPAITYVTSVNQEHGIAHITSEYGAPDTMLAEQIDVRQTFVLGQQYLEGLKNFVHTKRMNGQYDFTQKQALHQALDLLFATASIEERPLQIRQKEEVRRQQIRKGKLK